MADMGLQADFTEERPTKIRHVVVFVSMLMAVLLYLDRFCVSFAVDYIREDLSLTQTQISWFLSAFFWSYALAQVPSGWFSDRYGARIMLVVYILSWSFFTAMIGAVHSFTLLLVARLGCGLGQAGAYPTSASLVSKWVPFSNRGTASSIIAFGGRLGGAMAPFLTAWLMVLFVPMSEPVALQDSTLLHGPRLAARLSPLESTPPSRLATESDTPAVSTGDVKLTKPTAAGRRIWTFLPEDLQVRITAAADDFRAHEAEHQRLLEQVQQASDRQIRRERRRTADEVEQRLGGLKLDPALQSDLLAAINGLLDRGDLYTDDDFKAVNLPSEATRALKRLKNDETLTNVEQRRFNRLLLEGAFPRELGKLYVNGWRPVMYVYGFAGLFVAAIFWFYFRDRPEQHPGCNAAERELIAAGRPANAPSPHGKAGGIPLKRLVLSRSMWFMCLAQLGTNMGWVFLVTWLPRYLIDVHNVPILERGLMAMMPMLIGIGGMLAGGVFTDALVPKIGLRWGRRLPMMVTRFTAAAGYGLCLWFAAQSPGSWWNSPWMFIAAFSLVAFSTDMGAPSTWAFKQDVGGRYVGSILGWGNMWGNLGAAMSPPIYNFFLGETPTIQDWNTMFLVGMGAFAFAGICALGIDATIPIAPPDEDE
jgi:MFS transporter, ACS family, glucarate transporter